MPRTLVIHVGAIGDFLLALPAIAALRTGGDMELAGHRERLALAVQGGIAHAAHSLDAIEFHTVFGAASEKLRDFASAFDHAIVWMRDPDNALQKGLAACGVEQVDVFPGLPETDWRHHASQYYAKCLGVAIPEKFLLDIAPMGMPLDVVIHPGSGSPGKNWPPENFDRLAADLRDTGRHVTWCRGPAELERRDLPRSTGASLRCDSLVALAARLATARLYIGNDSGITHLAAALGVPTVAIFGPTNPAVWAPRGENVRVVTGDPWPTLDEVLLVSSTPAELSRGV